MIQPFLRCSVQKLQSALKDSFGLNQMLVCCKINSVREAVYQCLDCDHEQYSYVFCQSCFDTSKHKGHRFKSTFSQKGFCDCGQLTLDPLVVCEFHKRVKSCFQTGYEVTEQQQKAIQQFKQNLRIFLGQFLVAYELSILFPTNGRQIINIRNKMVELNQLFNNRYTRRPLLVKKIVFEVLEEASALEMFHNCSAQNFVYLFPQTRLRRTCSCKFLDLIFKIIEPVPQIQNQFLIGLVLTDQHKLIMANCYSRLLPFILLEDNKSKFDFYHYFTIPQTMQLLLSPASLGRIESTSKFLQEQLELAPEFEDQYIYVKNKILALFAFYAKNKLHQFAGTINIAVTVLNIIKHSSGLHNIRRKYHQQSFYQLSIRLLPILQRRGQLYELARVAFTLVQIGDKQQDSKLINSDLIRFWTLLRLWMQMHDPTDHNKKLMTVLEKQSAELQEFQFKFFQRTLATLSWANKCMSQCSPRNQQIKAQYFDTYMYQTDLLAIKAYLLLNQSPKLAQPLFYQNTLTPLQISRIMFDQLTLSMIFSWSSDQTVQKQLDAPVRGLLATAFRYQTPKNFHKPISFYENKYKHFWADSKRLDRIKIQARLQQAATNPECLLLSDLMFLVSTPRLDQYLGLAKTRKEADSLITSGYLNQFPNCMSLRLINRLANMKELNLPSILSKSLQLSKNERAESLLILRAFYWLVRMNQLSSDKLEYLLPQQFHCYMPVIAGQGQKKPPAIEKPQDKKHIQKFHDHAARQHKIEPHSLFQIDSEPNSVCLVCIDQTSKDSMMFLSYISSQGPRVCINYCSHTQHAGCLLFKYWECPACRFTGNCSIVACVKVKQIEGPAIKSLQEFEQLLQRQLLQTFLFDFSGQDKYVQATMNMLLQYKPDDVTNWEFANNVLSNMLMTLPFTRKLRRQQFAKQLLGYMGLAFRESVQAGEVYYFSWLKEMLQQMQHLFEQQVSFESVFINYLLLTCQLYFIGDRVSSIHKELAATMMLMCQQTQKAKKTSETDTQINAAVKLQNYEWYGRIAFALNVVLQAKIAIRFTEDEQQRLSLISTCESFCEKELLSLRGKKTKAKFNQLADPQFQIPALSKITNYLQFHEKFFALPCETCVPEDLPARSFRNVIGEHAICLLCGKKFCEVMGLMAAHWEEHHFDRGFFLNLNSGVVLVAQQRLCCQVAGLFKTPLGKPFTTKYQDWRNSVVDQTIHQTFKSILRENSIREFIVQSLNQ